MYTLFGDSMDLKNKLTQQQLDNLKNNNAYNTFEKSTDLEIKESIEKQNMSTPNEVKFFDVLTDEINYWVSLEDMKKICGQLYGKIFDDSNFPTAERMFEGKHVSVTKSFIEYVQDNTKNPKYISRLCLLRNIDKSEDYNKLSDQFIESSYDEVLENEIYCRTK